MRTQTSIFSRGRISKTSKITGLQASGVPFNLCESKQKYKVTMVANPDPLYMFYTTVCNV